ncbi:TPA: anaerobic sulfatase maturase [Klebsiella aerogenes]|uniref:Anaerobic sulfatase maturase n=2 Tax=Enterobacterales TaxID=91347 RepID=A0AAP9QXE2_KLEAE|nr:anaerobic sulfatase maturase [Klebsiella aerogenes]EIV2083376.1 anaerobic sulfatase maturase [Klebsiella aerogenes]EIW9211617.1 anaerobic sulfatase maturase [Klebsiella aerogenes]EKM7810104.1 anaerobic sulfatase maturase [Klebsiella aerogenes]EKU4512592.1 anaerobic sulfatase maturase [Klebsiella aerogenes]EKU7553586.1 anaerobic sulfatase maturase [Klebsiella aerogenes]
MKHSTTVPVNALPSAEKYAGNGPAYQRRFHVMAKPTGSACNIDCSYCFYLHKEHLLQQEKRRYMSDETLENFIRQYIDGQDGEQVVFSWQGGEPTLMGLEFFHKVVKFQQQYKKPGQRIENDLQTNGILINDAWAEFLKANHFLVGLSIDGPRELHDRYRITRSGKPTFDKVMAGVDALKRHGVPFNALVTVNRTNARFPLEVYRFVTRELGATYVQFNPCVEPVDFTQTAPHFWRDDSIPTVGSRRARPGDLDAIVTDWSVDPDDWGRFLIATFEEWVNNDLGRVQVNLFETAVAQMMGLPAQICTTAEFCGKGLAVEKNGDVFSCDHYVYPEYQIGNIADNSLARMAFSERQQAFGMGKCDTLPQQCKQCPYLKLCHGECPKNRLVLTTDGEAGLNYLCPGIKAFFNYAEPILAGIVTLVKRDFKGVSR